MSESIVMVMIDSATGNAPTLQSGDSLVMVGAPRSVRGELRQMCEVRRLLPVEQARVAVYDALESLRGRVEVAGVRRGEGSPKVRAQRLKSAAKIASAAVEDLARSVESEKQ